MCRAFRNDLVRAIMCRAFRNDLVRTIICRAFRNDLVRAVICIAFRNDLVRTIMCRVCRKYPKRKCKFNTLLIELLVIQVFVCPHTSLKVRLCVF